MKLNLDELTSKILVVDSISQNCASSLSKKILEIEPTIKELNKDNYSNLYTNGTDSNVLLKYNNYYNLINFGFEEVDYILEKTKQSISTLTQKNEFYIKMWANIYRNGDYIGYHQHVKHTTNIDILNKHFSGHCFLYSNEPTSTTYYFSGNKKKLFGGQTGTDILNVPGEISIFSSFLPHEFKKWNGELRIGIAFDIILDVTLEIERNPYNFFRLVKY